MFSHRKFFRLENLFNRPKKLKNISQTYCVKDSLINDLSNNNFFGNRPRP